jgi:group I intron endonuclease
MARDYKTGIYKITNRVNGKFYIGSSINITNRWKAHIYRLNSGTHVNRHLQSAWNKYGSESFIFERIERIVDKNLLIEREQSYLDILKPYHEDIGYNLSPIAGSTLGVKYSEESKKKMGEWVRTDEMRKNMSAAQRKLYSDPIMKERSRVAMIKFYEKNPDKIKNGTKNGMAKPIYQYNFETGQLIRKWDFANQIFHETNWTLASIRDNCNLKKNKKGEVVAFKDFIWSYYEINDMSAYKSNNNIVIRYKHRGSGDYHNKIIK